MKREGANGGWGRACVGGNLEAAFQRSVFNFELSLVMRGKASLSSFVVSSFLPSRVSHTSSRETQTCRRKGTHLKLMKLR